VSGRWIMIGLLVAAAAVAEAQTQTVTLTWIANAPFGDNQIIQRRTAHCLTSDGTWADLITVGPTATSYVDTASPFPYACYRIRAVLAGQPDSAYSNEDWKDIPPTPAGHGLRRR
jgi:hypothetical protein